MEDIMQYLLDTISAIPGVNRDIDIVISCTPLKDGKVLVFYGDRYYGEKEVIIQVDREQIH